jgi:hypothetical protein
MRHLEADILCKHPIACGALTLTLFTPSALCVEFRQIGGACLCTHTLLQRCLFCHTLCAHPCDTSDSVLMRALTHACTPSVETHSVILSSDIRVEFKRGVWRPHSANSILSDIGVMLVSCGVRGIVSHSHSLTHTPAASAPRVHLCGLRVRALDTHSANRHPLHTL